MEGIYNKVEELLEDINKQIADIKKEITEYCEKNIKQLSLEIEKAKASKKLGRVEEGKTYYAISSSNFIYTHPIAKIRECNEPFDRFQFEIVNYFRTEEEAKKAFEKVQIYTRLKRFAEENNTEKIDFNDSDQEKCCIIYIADRDSLFIEQCLKDKDIGQIYFTSEELAEQAIKEIGEENIKKLFD